MPDVSSSVLVKPGDKVTKGQDVVILEAMKMENSIVSYAGTVKQVLGRAIPSPSTANWSNRIAIARNNFRNVRVVFPMKGRTALLNSENEKILTGCMLVWVVGVSAQKEYRAPELRGRAFAGTFCG